MSASSAAYRSAAAESPGAWKAPTEHALGFRAVTPGVWAASSVVEGLLRSLIGGAKKP